jgi:hypothetical protein
MKKILTLILLFISFSGFAQVRTFLGPKGVLIYDTTKYLQSGSSYILLPNDSTISFDSSKVGVSLAKNATRDSIRLISGSGSILSTVKDSTGSAGVSYTGANGIRLFGTVFKIPIYSDYASGAGKKIMIDSANVLIRAGQVTGAQWDLANLGAYSVAFGLNNTASATYSFANGNANTASGNASVALGASNTASATGAIALGESNTVGTNINGIGIGFQNTITGSNSFGIGRQNTVAGGFSGALGYGNNSSADRAYSLGVALVSKSYNGVAIGAYNDPTAAASSSADNVLNRAFQVGAGTATAGLEKNVITSLFNGNTGLGPLVPTATLHLRPGTEAAGTAPIKFSFLSATTTAASGTGSVATITFATTTVPIFQVGSQVVVTGVTPAGYNGTYTVTYSSSTQIKYANATTGSQTVAGTITQGGVLTTPEANVLEPDAKNLNYTDNAGLRGKIARTFTGTAAPATTPSSVGDFFVDTVNAKLYVATGTASSADWTILN